MIKLALSTPKKTPIDVEGMTHLTKMRLEIESCKPKLFTLSFNMQFTLKDANTDYHC